MADLLSFDFNLPFSNEQDANASAREFGEYDPYGNNTFVLGGGFDKTGPPPSVKYGPKLIIPVFLAFVLLAAVLSACIFYCSRRQERRRDAQKIERRSKNYGLLESVGVITMESFMDSTSDDTLTNNLDRDDLSSLDAEA